MTADFNGDGRLDLATPNGVNTVSVLLGNGDGTFLPAQTSATGAYPSSLAAGDVDGDGNVDLATANASNVSFLRGNGDGTFADPVTYSVGTYPTSVAIGDFTGDGLKDLGVVSYSVYVDYYGYASVLAGDGTGSFSGPNTIGINYGACRSAIAVNVDGVGADELVTTNQGSYSGDGRVYTLAADGAGSLYVSNVLYTGIENVDLAAGDVNGDGAPDLVTANGYYNGSVSVFLADGLGGFGAAHSYAAGSSPISVVLGDFDGDSNVDIATASSIADNMSDVSVLFGYGNGAFSAPSLGALGQSPCTIAAGDFNGDGRLDLAKATYDDNTVSVLVDVGFWPPPPPPLSVSINDATVTEGNTGTVNATFTVTLLYASNVDVTVHYDTADITAAAGSDYTAASGDVLIPAGQTSRTFTVAVKGDRLAEPTETFAVNLSAPTNATIGDGRGIGTILDNEPRISISDVTKSEGTTKGNAKKTTLFTFTVTLSATYDQAVTVSFRTVDGTAKTSDSDYIAETGTLTFAPGETTMTITIEVKGDNKKEANETFYVDLFGDSSNSLFTKNRGVGTILNDD